MSRRNARASFGVTIPADAPTCLRNLAALVADREDARMEVLGVAAFIRLLTAERDAWRSQAEQTYPGKGRRS